MIFPNEVADTLAEKMYFGLAACVAAGQAFGLDQNYSTTATL